jgi:hypothetical protein
MMNFPNIRPGQFVVMFLDRNTGHIYDIHLELYLDTPDNNQNVYAALNSFTDAKEYADQKIKSVKRHGIDFGYMIYDNKEEVVLDRDSGRD